MQALNTYIRESILSSTGSGRAATELQSLTEMMMQRVYDYLDKEDLIKSVEIYGSGFMIWLPSAKSTAFFSHMLKDLTADISVNKHEPGVYVSKTGLNANSHTLFTVVRPYFSNECTVEINNQRDAVRVDIDYAIRDKYAVFLNKLREQCKR